MILSLLLPVWATPTLYAPDAAEHPRLELGVGPTVVLRGDTVPAGLRVDATAQSGRAAGFFSSTSLWSADPDYFLTLGGRYRLIDHPGFRLAPFVATAAHFAEAGIDNRLTGRIGLALEGGGARWRYDLSLPVFGVAWFPDPDVESSFSLLYPIESFLTVEGGVSYLFPEHHRLRLGLVGIFPALSYRYDGSLASTHVFVEVLAGTMGPNSLFSGRMGLSW